MILSKNTGINRPYGRNSYSGYDDVNKTPYLAGEIEDDRLKPMRKVIGLRMEGQQKAYPYDITQDEQIINDEMNDKSIVIFHLKGARLALDAPKISQFRKDRSTGAYLRTVEGEVLEFDYKRNSIKDINTGSAWDITGKAVSGPLEGTQLDPLVFGDYFAFVWLVFWLDTEIYH